MSHLYEMFFKKQIYRDKVIGGCLGLGVGMGTDWARGFFLG